jgi:hypothetical protein
MKDQNVIDAIKKANEEKEKAQKKEKEAQREKEKAQQKEKEASSKYIRNENGYDYFTTFTDKEKGWTWAGSDSEEELSWSEASKFCREIGSGWDLPTREQLRVFYQKGDRMPPPDYDPYGYNRKYPKEFDITGYNLWDNQNVLLSWKSYINLSDGELYNDPPKAQALCVKTKS